MLLGLVATFAVAAVALLAGTVLGSVSDDGPPAQSSAASARTGTGSEPVRAPEPPAYQDLLAEGAKVYAASCFVCHGGVGDGNGPGAANLSTPARDFTDKDWMSSQSDGVFYTSIQRGVPGTPMPAFAGRLSEREIWAVTAYIRGFSPKVELQTDADRAEGTEAQRLRGRKVFEAQCAGCHGQQGLGDGEAAASFDTAPRNLADGDWLSGRSDDQLRSSISHGVPGTPMPAFYGDLSGPEMDAVVSYLRQLGDVQQRPNPLVGWAEDTYLAYCASCHGVDGDGAGIAAGRIDPVPRSFRNPAWMAGQTAAKLEAAVRHGRSGTAMPPFGAILDDDEIARLVEYIRAFSGPEAIPGSDSAFRYDPSTVAGVPSTSTDRPTKR